MVGSSSMNLSGSKMGFACRMERSCGQPKLGFEV